jgi:hypothetical protein
METQNKDLEYYRKNAEEDYLTTPISVLRYISEMEAALRQLSVIGLVCDKCEGHVDTDALGRYCTNCEKYVD